VFGVADEHIDVRRLVMPLVISDETLRSAKLTETEMQVEIACALFDSGKLALWPAAKLAGLSRGEFEEELAMRNIPAYRPTAEDWEVDKRTIAELEAKSCPSS
jgi:predicted HTH domain antitoxin